MTSKFTIDDIVTKRLTVDGKKIQSLNLGTLVVIDPSYNVGIGTSAPKLRLDISGSNGIRIPVGTSAQRPTTGGNGPTDLSGVLRYNTELNQYEAWALDGWQAFGGSNLQLYNQSANPKIQLTRAVSAYSGNNDGGVIEFRLNKSNSLTYQARISAMDSTNNAGYGSLVFSTSAGTNPVERMTIDHNGDVDISDNLTVGGLITGDVSGSATTVDVGAHTNITGVGTLTSSPSPDRALDVLGNIKVEKSGSVDTFVELISNNKKGYLLNNDGTLKLHTNISSNDLILQGTGGGVKIGNFSTTNPNTNNQVLQITAGVRQISIGGNNSNTYIQAHEVGNYDSNAFLNITGYRLKLLGNNDTGITVMETGKVGIGTTSPDYPLTIETFSTLFTGHNSIFWTSSRNLHVIGTTTSDGGTLFSANSSDYITANYLTATGNVSIRSEYGIWTDLYLLITSDKRIKENIRDVSDNVALQKLRDISCCFYEYKDKINKGISTNLGFIAQQVRKHLPQAISIQRAIIPNEMRRIENSQWTTLTDASGNNTYKLTIPDLEDASGNIKYRFYMSNDPSGNDECKKEITSLENDPKSFIFEEQWQNVFLYGKEVDDFHTLDKQKLFALNFSASQEIDRIQQQEKAKLTAAHTKLEEQTLKLATAEAKITTLEAENTTLKARLDAIEAKLILL